MPASLSGPLPVLPGGGLGVFHKGHCRNALSSQEGKVSCLLSPKPALPRTEFSPVRGACFHG